MKVLKSQFANNDGVLTKKGHIVPVNDAQEMKDVQDGSQNYESSNPEVATVAVDPEKEDGLIITWVGEGKTKITASADADLGDGVKTITGELELELVDEATSLNIVLD